MAQSRDPDGEGVGRRTFSTSFRGFDQGEVRAYLAQLAEEFASLTERIATLEVELEEARRPPDRPTVDIASLTAALGEETGNVLRVAKETAEELRTRAEEGAARTLREAHEEATRIRAAAESVLGERTAEAEQAAARIRAVAEEEAARVRNHAESEAEGKIAQAIATGKDMVGQAQAARERVLADLSRRRNSALHQLEALRAGRDALVGSFAGARTELDRLFEDLAQADNEARRAAESVGRPRPASTEEPDLAGAPGATEEHAAEPVEAVTPDPEPQPPPQPEPEPDPAAAVDQTPVPDGEPEAEAGADDVSDDAAPTPDAPPEAAEPEAEEEAPVDDEVAVSEEREAAPTTERPAYPHDPVPAAVLTGPAVGGPKRGGRVDQLFARMRAADRPEAVAAPAAAAPPSAPDVVVEDPPAVEDTTLEAPRTDIDEAYLQERDTLVEAAHSKVTKSLKRALADDQNGALEHLRKVKGDTVDLDALLDDETTQVRSWVRRASTGLVDAAAAGARLAGGNPPADLASVAEVAARLSVAAVQPLRARLADVIESADGDRGGAMADRINGVFREARGRLDRLVGDAVTEAVSAGFIAGVEPGTVVRWVVEDVDGPCPDCDDNALAGATTVGETFPTGQVAPPAHPGCRCILMRTTT